MLHNHIHINVHDICIKIKLRLCLTHDDQMTNTRANVFREETYFFTTGQIKLHKTGYGKGTQPLHKPGALCNIEYPSETHYKFRSCKIVFNLSMTYYFSYPIVLQFLHWARQRLKKVKISYRQTRLRDIWVKMRFARIFLLRSGLPHELKYCDLIS